MKLDAYPILAKEVVFEEEIKKSRFISQIIPVDSLAAAKVEVERVRTLHPAARHHCWAVVAGRADDSMLWGFSDDGEPSGTAGKPILSQLSGSGIGQMLAVVTRYSGGIKLGTGGLVKAYGGGVAQALKLAETINKKITAQLKLGLDYDQMPLLQMVMAQFNAQEVQASYNHDIQILVELEARDLDAFKQMLINKSSAKIQISQSEDN
ncbi:MAG: YigZ family protein [Vibrio sp.]